MFKPKPQQKEEPPKNMRLPQEPQQPNMKLVRNMFDECERRRGTTIELPWTNGIRSFLLMVLWEKSMDFPMWTMYDEAGGDNAMLFSQAFPPSDLDFVLEMIIMSSSQGAPAPAGGGYIPEELRPTADSLAAQEEEVKKPDDIWKSRVSDSLARNTHSQMSSVYPDPLPRPEAPQAVPPPPMPPMPQAMPQMAPPMPPQPGYPPNYQQPGMQHPGAQYPGMPPAPGYPPQPAYPPQPGYPPQAPAGYPPQQMPGYPPQPGYPAAQPQMGWNGAPPAAPSTPAPMPIDMGLISKRTDVTLNNLLLESGLLNSQSLDAAIRMQDLVEEKQLSPRDAARVLARYHSKGKTIEQFIGQAMQELGDNSGGAGGASTGGAGAANSGQGQSMVSVKDALDLLVKSGVLTDNDIQTANEVRKKHGGDISKILGAANKLDEKTFEASIICVKLIRDGAMKIEQVSMALQYCSRMRTSFDDACSELGWPNPRAR